MSIVPYYYTGILPHVLKQVVVNSDNGDPTFACELDAGLRSISTRCLFKLRIASESPFNENPTVATSYGDLCFENLPRPGLCSSQTSSPPNRARQLVLQKQTSRTTLEILRKLHIRELTMAAFNTSSLLFDPFKIEQGALIHAGSTDRGKHEIGQSQCR